MHGLTTDLTIQDKLKINDMDITKGDGWHGFMAPDTFEEFKVMMAIAKMMSDAEEVFKEHLGRYFDLGCSMEKLYGWVLSPKKYKFMVAVEQEDMTMYVFDTDDNINDDIVREMFDELGADVMINGKSADDHYPMFICNFEKDYLTDKECLEDIEEQWNQIEKIRKKSHKN